MNKKTLFILKTAFIFFLVLLVVSRIRPTPAFAEGNPFVPTTDTLGTGLIPQIGGEELDTASVDIANFSDISGAYYDSILNRIVFIGTTTGTPKYNQDDMAVAIKSIFYNNVMPDVGILDDPNNPSSSSAIVTYSNGLQNTNFGNVLFNTDYKYKQYAIGYDPNGVKVTSNVSTYKSVVDRYLALQPSPVAGNESKYILSPQTITIKNSPSTSAFVFSGLTMQATAQPVNQNNDPLWNQAANNFASDITSNYGQYAQESSTFAQTQQLTKITAVLKWISDKSIPTDLHSIQNYTPSFVSTPTTVQKVATPTGGYSAQGEINYNTPNTYIPDDGTAAGLKASSQAASSSKEDVTWTFTNGGQQYTAVAVTAIAFKSLGAYATSVTDMPIPIAGDLTLAFKRTYSSFSTAQNGIGMGWDIMPAHVYDNSYPQPINISICPDSTIHLTKLAIDTQNGHETFTFNCSNNSYGADDPSFHSNVNVSGDFSSATVVLSDQTKYAFTLNSGLGIYQLASYTDKNGNKINYTYDGSGKLTNISDTHSHILALSYNGQNLISSVTDWSNRKIQYAYDSVGRLTGVTDPNNNTTLYGYDSGNRLVTITDRTGQVVLVNTYGGDNRIATQKNASNVTRTYSYDNVNRIITQTDNNGRIVRTSYDSKARILQQTDPANKIISYTYGNEAVPLTQTDRDNNTSAYTYDSHGNVLTVKFPNNVVITYTYDGNNRITKIMDARYNPAKETDYSYDNVGNLTQKTVAGIITKYSYDTTGELLTITDPLTNRTTWTRDTLGNPLTQVDPYNKTTTFTYDVLGRLTQAKDANNNTITYSYDGNDNLLTKTDAIGTTTNSYDKENRLTKITLPNNAAIQYFYNSSGSLLSATDASNGTTSYGYDSYQNLTSQQDALSHITTNTFNNLDRQISSSTPMGKVSSWQYDPNGNLVQRIDANNKTTNYLYDSLNRLIKITYSDNSTITYTYDNRGNMTQMIDFNGTSTYTYDTFDRLTKSTNPYSQSLQYVYDNAGNNTQITYPDGKIVTYTYDQNNRMTSVKDWNNKTTIYTYNSNGILASRAYPNGITTYYTYDNANRLTTLEHKKGTTSVAKFTYIKDATGNITSAVEAGQFVGLSETNTFSYDNLGRIKNAVYGYPQANITYTYDSVGNILSRVDTSHNTSTSYTYDADNKMTIAGGNSYSYDNNGNQLTVPYSTVKNLTYNLENNLIKNTDQFNNTDTYKYDGLGNRLEMDDKVGNKTRFMTDISSNPTHVLEDYSLVFNKVKGWYIYGLNLVSGWGNYADSTSANYFLEDGMGNTRFTTNVNGSSGSTLSYDPFGNNTYSSGNGYGNVVKKTPAANQGAQTLTVTQNIASPGYEYDEQHVDADTGFYYLRSRYYDPATGRFLSKDPVGGSVRNPLSQNPYLYGFDNPINNDDPSGQNGVQILINQTNGMSFERYVLSYLGLKKNTSLLDGYRVIPDILNPGKYFGEIKSGSYLYLSRQFRAFIQYAKDAKDNIANFRLYINQDTELSQPLENALEEIGTTIERIPPPPPL